MLSPYRVLDLTDDRGYLAGFLLAQLGAEVITVEPPGGHRHRHQHPYAADRPNPDRSLWHLAHDRGKASVVLDDPGALDTLAAGADILLECGALPIDLDRLRATNPQLITVSISPWGDDGPKAGWAATDLIVAAASGVMSLTGDQDRRPLRISLPQSWHQAAADAACGALIALWERHRSGLGQHVDVSAQQATIATTQFQMMTTLVGAASPRRLPGGVQLGPFTVRFVHACKDGHVTVTFLFGLMMGPFTARLFRWMHDEGFADESLRDKNWVDFAMDVLSGKEPATEMDRATAAIAAFFATKTKDELLAAALEKGLLIAPVTTTRDVLGLEQLDDRRYWETLDGVRHPGAMAKFSATPLPPLPEAPSLGRDTARILAEPARRPAVDTTGAAPAAPLDDPRPLAGIKVLDFMWALAGPGATRTLADHGATVVKVETQSRADVLRGVHPFIGEDGGQENALQFHSLNAGKLGLSLNLSKPQARAVILDLVRWADVLTESFSPKAMTAWGLSYEDLIEVNPQLIMFSSCLMGQTGPMRMYAGFGTMAAAIAGFYPIAGWPDRPPAGPFTAYTDYISPRFGVMTVLAALDQRRRTGQGQHIDFSQFEGSLHLLTPAFLDDQYNDRVAGPVGNADLHRAPHDVYPVAGDDRWLAVACETDAQWAALAQIIGRDDLAGLDLDSRRARLDEIDAAIAAWSTPLDRHHAAETLQAAGIPAHVVADSGDVVGDPQLQHRRQFRAVPHPVHGTSFVEGASYRLSRTPGEPRWAGPTFGQHLEEVLAGILGYDGDRIADLIIAEVLE